MTTSRPDLHVTSVNTASSSFRLDDLLGRLLAGNHAQLCKLNRERTRGGTATVDQERKRLLGRLRWKRKAKRLIETLADGGDTDTKRRGFFERQTIRNLDLKVAFRDDIVRKGSVVMIVGIA